MIEFTDDSPDEDIFTPVNSSLDGLFTGQKKAPAEASSSLKYQAPMKNEEKSASKSVVIVNAFTWDGAAYQPVGKLGLTLALKDEKAFVVLYKSKQQTLFMLDITLEQLKIEQHSDISLGTLDSQVC